MSVMALLNMAGEEAAPGPAAAVIRAGEIKCLPCPRMRGVLKDPAIGFECNQCGFEASAIVAKPVLVRLARGAMPVAAPSLAWRMSNDRMRTGILSSIPALIPGIDIFESEVTAAGFDIEGRYHRAAQTGRGSMTLTSLGSRPSCNRLTNNAQRRA